MSGYSMHRTICLALLCHTLLAAALENDAISGHIRKCCVNGVKHARKHDQCQNYMYEVNAIPPLWRGLCYSTFGVCCSREVEQRSCHAGRQAALTVSRCNEPFNASTTYVDCCRWCQVGLGVKASDSSCDDPLFSYFNEIESFRICCESSNMSNSAPKSSTSDKVTEEQETEISVGEHVEANTNDGTIVLPLDDYDICSKVPNLCQHICENTQEAYRCKCYPGFKLNSDNQTCTIEKHDTTYSTEDDTSDWDHTEDECLAGYVYDKITRKCVDLNECSNNGLTSPCKENQFCHNTVGSYRCLNKTEEFTFLDDDEDECSSIGCEEGYTCEKHMGRFKCLEKCEKGYELILGTCVDIDECALDDRSCLQYNQVCVNDPGGFHCECKLGFKYDNVEKQCVDINECSINNHNCLATQRCDNTLGSYICTRIQSCGTGYTLDADSGNCLDNDECKLGTHNCPPTFECRNTEGSFRCYRRETTTTTTSTTKSPTNYNGYITFWNRSQTPLPKFNSQTYDRNYVREHPPTYMSKENRVSCDIGFQRSALGACVDIDECVQYRPCQSHQLCINTNGSFRCKNVLECGSGYKANPNGTMCMDVNECETGEHNCAETQTCENRVGGFICFCPPGYELKHTHSSAEKTCVDIDECEQKRPSACPLNAQCLNTMGSYYCDCKSGFQKSRENERICVDVDECRDIQGLCQHKCNNFWGGYRCSCEIGYELGLDNRTCVDINECEVHKNHKLCMGHCINVPGSYECSCPRGYTIDSDKVRCRDIDECSTGDFCTGRYDVCTNIHGSYRCTTINCPYGYRNDPNQKNRCLPIQKYCDGEDCYTKPSGYTYTFITLTSNLIVPPEGRSIFALHGPSFYENIDFELQMVRSNAAYDVEKATENHFHLRKENKSRLTLQLMRTLEGPQDIELEISMTVFSQGLPRAKMVSKILIIVSQYDF